MTNEWVSLAGSLVSGFSDSRLDEGFIHVLIIAVSWFI